MPLNLCFVFQPDLHSEIFLLTGESFSILSIPYIVTLVELGFPSLKANTKIYFSRHIQIITSHSSITASKGDTAKECWTPIPSRHGNNKNFIAYCICGRWLMYGRKLMFINDNYLLLYPLSISLCKHLTFIKYYTTQWKWYIFDKVQGFSRKLQVKRRSQYLIFTKC